MDPNWPYVVGPFLMHVFSCGFCRRGWPPLSRERSPTTMKLTHSQAVARLRDIETELEQLAKKTTLERSDGLRSAALTVEADELNEHRKRLERGHELARGGA